MKIGFEHARYVHLGASPIGDFMLGCVGSDVLGYLYWVVVGGRIDKVPYGMRPEFCR